MGNVQQLRLDEVGNGPVSVHRRQRRLGNANKGDVSLGIGDAGGRRLALRFDYLGCFLWWFAGHESASIALCVEEQTVGSHCREREQIEKRLRGLLALCSGVVVADELSDRK